MSVPADTFRRGPALSELREAPHGPLLDGRLRDLLAWPDWRRSLAAAAARQARGRYRWEQIAAETEAVYAWVRATAGAGRESDGVRS